MPPNECMAVFDSSEWKWRRQRWRNALADLRARLKDRGRQIRYPHKVCPECGNLLGGSVAVCDRCGARTGAWSAHVFQRLVRTLSPGEAPVTFLLMAANLVIAFFTLQLDQRLPAVILHTGGLIFPTMQMEGTWWRLITYGFLHGGILHLVFNMMALYQFGPELERLAGSRRLFVLYMAANLGGGLADFLVRGNQPLFAVGASGAICGLIGAMLAYVHLRGLNRMRAQLMRGVGYMVLYSLLFELTGGVRVDHVAHAGGFLAGGLIGALTEREERLRGDGARRWAARAWQCAQLAGLASLFWAGSRWWAAIRAVLNGFH